MWVERIEKFTRSFDHALICLFCVSDTHPILIDPWTTDEESEETCTLHEMSV